MKTWKVASLILFALAVAAAGYASILVRRTFSALATPSAIEEFAATTARKMAMPSAYRPTSQSQHTFNGEHSGRHGAFLRSLHHASSSKDYLDRVNTGGFALSPDPV